MSFNEKYYGSRCKVCSEELDSHSDIVVCPDCGTPYHKECWKKEGKCVNTALHESGGAWEPPLSSNARQTAESLLPPYPQTEGYPAQAAVRSGTDIHPADNAGIPAQPEGGAHHLACPNCGKFNPSDFSFCSRCGFPVGDYHMRRMNLPNGTAMPPVQYGGRVYRIPANRNGANQGGEIPPQKPPMPDPNAYMPFGGMTINFDDRYCGFSPDEDMGGAEVREAAEYVDTNTHYFLPLFKRFADTGHKVSWNFCAMAFPVFYFSYRKMYGYALLCMLMRVLIWVPTIIALLSQQTVSFGLLSEWAGLVNQRSDAFLILQMMCNILSYVLMFVTGGYANYLYYRKMTGNIIKIKEKNPEAAPEQLMKKIKRKGRTNAALLVVLLSLAVLGFYALGTAGLFLTGQ